MKKIFAWVLLLTLMLGLFAGCKKTDTPTDPTVGDYVTAEAAMEYLKALYKSTDEATKTPRDYERYGVIRVGGEPFEIVWTVDLDTIQVVPGEDEMVKIDIDEQCQEDTPYVLTATITDKGGNSVSYSWNYIMPKAMDVGQILKDAYALADGESLPYEVTLTGKLISIDTMYSAEYQNITVTMAVEGYEEYPIQCYRLKGDGIDQLAVGNIITVTGTIKNYNGTIEFDSGCILESWEKGDAVDAPEDPLEIVKAAYALKDGESLPYVATLTGKVTEIDTPYDPDYSNISVVMVVEGAEDKPITCYRLKGTGVDQIAVDDIITVMGIIKNYKGTIEFDTGCQMIDRISGGRQAEQPSSDPAKIFADAKKLKSGQHLNYYATLTGKVTDIESPYDKEYSNITVVMSVKGYESYPIICYRLKGTGVEKIARGDTITVKGIIENYNGKLEFGSGCTLLDRVSGGGVAKPETSNVKTIMTDAAKLASGQHLDYYSSLKGKVIDIETPYDKNYDNITVVIEVEGYENMPITCYRLKSGDVYSASKIARGDTITVRGVLENYNGKLEYGSGCTLTYRKSGGGTVKPETTNVKTIMTDAAKLASGEHLDYYSTLKGKVIDIETPYDKNYDNITVVMEVEGYEDSPITCYRLTTGRYKVSNIARGDTITVRGVLENYNGKLEYGSGCTLQKRVSGGGTAKAESSNAKTILADAAKLAEGDKLDYFANLTGKVVDIDTPYDKAYDNISVYIEVSVDGKTTTMLCYRLKSGDVYSVSKIARGDTITVRGVIENYDGDVQFGSGSTLTYRKSGGGTVKPETDNVKTIMTDAKALEAGEKLDYFSTLAGKVIDIETPYDKNYDNITVVIEVEGYEADPITCYRLTSGKADASKIALGDTITVRGVLEYYNGEKLEYGSGCTLEKRVSGGGTAKPESDDQAAILADAANLASGEALDYYSSLTGKVIEIETPYDKVYGNITVVIDVDGTQITCYRMKDGAEKVSQIAKGDTITVRGVLENYNGKLEYGTGCTLEKRVSGGGVVKPETDDQATILADAAKLAGGEHLDYYSSLTGTVTMIEEWYTTQHDNVTVVMDVDGTEITCYRMKSGDADASQVRVGDTITVRGVLERYVSSTKDKLEYGTGCTLEKLVKGTNPGDNMTAKEILTAAYALESASKPEDKKFLEGAYTLTGVISSVDTAYSSQYNNITVTMKVEGCEDMPIQCYRLAKGAVDVASLKVGDTITVYGSITKYNNKVQFDQGCVLIDLKAAQVETPDTPVEGVATVVIYNPANGKALSSVANGYYLTGVDVTASGSTVTGYGATEQWVLIDNGNGTYSFNYGGKNMAMGSSYTSTPLGEVNDDWKVIDAGNGLYYIENTNRTDFRLQWKADTSNFSAYQYNTTGDAFKFAFHVISGTLPNFEQSSGGTTPDVPGGDVTGNTPVDTPVAGTAYKWAIDQTNKGVTLYFAGTMNGFYGATTENVNEGVDVVLEEVSGGYYLSFTIGGAKKYVNILEQLGSDNEMHINFVIADTAATVYTYSTEHKTLVTGVNGTDYYIGTYNNYNTFSASTLDKIATSFPSYFCTPGGNGGIGGGGNTGSGDDNTGSGDADIVIPEGSPSLSFGDVANRVSYSAEQQVWQQNGITMTNDKASATNDVYDSSANTYVRLYQNSDVTVAYPGMTRIVFDVAFEDKVDALADSLEKIAGVTVTVNGLTVAADFAETDSLTISMVAQTRLNAITVCTGTTPPTGGGSTGGGNTGSGDAEIIIPEGSPSLSFGDVANRVSYSAEQQVWQQNGITMTNDKASATNDVYDSSANTYVRLYQGSDVTVAYPGMTRIVFDVAFEDKVDALADSLEKIAGVTVTVNGLTVAADFAETDSLTISMVAQTRLNAITVCTGTTPPTGGGSTDTPVTPPVSGGTDFVDAPVAGTPYKFGVNLPPKNNANYYVDGTNDAKYLNTTTDVASAIDVYFEEVTGGIRLYTISNGTKLYINVIPRETEPTKVRVIYQAETEQTPSVYTVNSQYKYLTTTVSGVEYTIGTYTNSNDGTTYETLSASKSSFLSNTSVIGVTQFPAWFMTGSGNQGGGSTGGNTGGSTGGDTAVDYVTAPVAGTGYKLGMDKGDGTVLYFNGQTDSVTYRLATTTNVNEAVDVYLENVSGGYQLYFMNGGTKTYIRVFHYTDGDPGWGKGSLALVTTAPSEYYTYDTNANTLVYDYDGNNAYYMGTYGTYTTFSVSNTSYITGDKASTVDVSQFPARLYPADGSSSGGSTGGNTGGSTGGNTGGSTGGNSSYVLVTDINEVKAGGTFVVAVLYEGEYIVLDDSFKTKPSGVVGGEGALTATALAAWTIAAQGDGISIASAGKYLSYVSSTNISNTTTAFEWSIGEGTAAGSFQIYSGDRYICYQYTDDGTTIRNRFGAYKQPQSKGAYEFDLYLFKVVE